jgi:hypothetical protein
VERLRLDLSLLLEAVDDVLAVPADLVRQALDGRVLAAGFEAENAQGLGDDDALLAVVRRGDTLKELDALERGGSARCLVWDHAANGAVDDPGGGAEVERTVLLGVDETACGIG